MLTRLTHQRSGEEGMTLVEIILVMGILSVVMLAVMSFYVPAHQSTIVQSEVTDVQSNLRLASNRISMDLITAGFLVDPDFDDDPTDSFGPGALYWETPPYNAAVSDDFTIRTRIIGNDFGRIEDAAPQAGFIRLDMSSAGMIELFPVGAQVRLFEPISQLEINDGMYTDADRVYSVVDSDGTVDPPWIDIDDPAGNLTSGDILTETVMLRVRNAAQPPMQTIRYRLNGDALERIINGTTIQILARHIESVNFDFDESVYGNVNKVDITLVGATEALTGKSDTDAIAGKKTRQVETTVMLRNVF